jgi:hypothetical protein
VGPVWSKQPPDTPEAGAVTTALNEVSIKCGVRKPAAALTETVDSEVPAHRFVAILGLGAIDDVPRLLDVLADGDPAHKNERGLAIFALRRYVDRSLADGEALYEGKTQTGILKDKRYLSREADLVTQLLHDFPEAEGRNPETFLFLLNLMDKQDRVAIRELAYWQLLRVAQPPPGVQPVQLPPFNAAWGEDQRRAAVAALKKLVEDGKLPARGMGPR